MAEAFSNQADDYTTNWVLNDLQPARDHDLGIGWPKKTHADFTHTHGRLAHPGTGEKSPNKYSCPVSRAISTVHPIEQSTTAIENKKQPRQIKYICVRFIFLIIYNNRHHVERFVFDRRSVGRIVLPTGSGEKLPEHK